MSDQLGQYVIGLETRGSGLYTVTATPRDNPVGDVYAFTLREGARLEEAEGLAGCLYLLLDNVEKRQPAAAQMRSEADVQPTSPPPANFSSLSLTGS